MFAKHFSGCKFMISGDRCRLHEIFNPATDPSLKLGYSLAHAVIKAGTASLPHALDRSEVYYIIAGSGTMHIGKETGRLEPGVTVYIPPGAVQYAECDSGADLEFVCMVDPGWTPSCEKIL